MMLVRARVEMLVRARVEAEKLVAGRDRLVALADRYIRRQFPREQIYWSVGMDPGGYVGTELS